MSVQEARRGRTSVAKTSVACGIVLALIGGRAHAQGATAQQRFDDGERWMAEGRLDEACAAFEESNRLDPRAGTLINLAECREQNHQLASAAAAYRDALTRVKDPYKRTVARRALAAIEPRLSYLTVVVADDRRPGGLAVNCDDRPLDPAQWNHPQAIDGGDHVIAAQADGREAWRTTVRVPVERGQIRVEVPLLVERRAPEPVPLAPAKPAAEPVAKSPAESAAKPAAEPAAEPAPVAPLVLTRDDRDARRSPSIVTRRRALGIGAAALGVGAGVLGAILGASASGKQHDALALCPDGPACQRADAANALISTGHRRALEANIAFGVAAGAAIAAGVLWFTGAPEPEPTRRVAVLPALAPGWAGIAVTGRL